MIVITSAEYVGSEFAAEIGKIPYCMLPIGNKKLVELQTQALRQVFPDEKIILSLPENYQLSIDEKNLIEQLQLNLHKVPHSFSLAEEILYLLNIEADKNSSQIRILFGNKLILDLTTQLDIIAVAATEKRYDWHVEATEDEKFIVWGGFFSFSSRALLIKLLALSKGKFTKAVQRYRREQPMQTQLVKAWYDCNYLNTFFNTRASITTQRSFNELVIKSDIVTKSSENNQKIRAEANWFLGLPPNLKKFTPQLIDYGVLEDGETAFYSLEYLPFLPLNELFVHGRNPVGFWRNIFKLLESYLTISTKAIEFNEQDKRYIEIASQKLYRDKTIARLERFSKESQFDLTQDIYYAGKNIGTVEAISQECIQKTLDLPYIYAVLHGDLCFSNILFDARGYRIKILDPRGMDDAGNISSLGNQTYDLAKLTHSVIGLYDFIIAGRYYLDFPQVSSVVNSYEITFDLDEVLVSIQETFINSHFHKDVTIQKIIPAVVLLFLSMLPLHADRPDRQRALLVNAFRLYADYVMN